MNSNPILLAFAALFTACLCSCASSSSGGGQVIHYPTVDDMARYESQWGMQPRQVKPRLRQAEPGDTIAPAPSIQSSTPAPSPEPIKELPGQPATADPSKLPQLR